VAERDASGRPARKFDPAKADKLDAPERDEFLPDDALLDLLALRGGETVVDYGAGTGRLARGAAERLVAGGRVVAVDESEEMLDRLRQRLATVDARVEPVLIARNRVALPDASIDRVIAVNLLHEVRGEPALTEMRRLLRPDGLALVADWARGRDPGREVGPPEGLLYTEQEAVAVLERAGFAVEPRDPFAYHFALLARPASR
jgi:ubiquinone/menaquinone biosynthesis C-methylase UbiE